MRLVFAVGVLLALVGELSVVELPVTSHLEARVTGDAEARGRCPIPAQFRTAFERAAAETAVPLPLLVAVAHEESRMDPTARSHAGAEGLLQLMPATARELRLDASVPDKNVLAGARYLRKMLDRFRSLDLALAAYNAGPTAVARAGGAPSAETLTYVANVLERREGLGACR